tara:strand:- start:107 stop:370 length:264 start_codon:yes stop_codon:yes gene_type:complete
MNKEFTKLVREILIEIIEQRSIVELDEPPRNPEDAYGDELITDDAFEDFMQFIDGLPKEMQIELITQYQNQLKQQLEDDASMSSEYD